ncbi:MAG: DUF2891 domain-containing protein [Planctomycetota bacterium]|nr:DUF2891 domain-containing protein [Planctomycetota bacterium]
MTNSSVTLLTRIGTLLFIVLFSTTQNTGRLRAQETKLLGAQSLSDEQVVQLAELALKGINQEFPNKPSNVMATKADVLSPQEMHPVFYGCFDWHSSVHGHWLLVRLIKLYPGNSAEEKIRQLLDSQFTKEKLQAEADYFDAKENKSFERMYGWAWALRLAAELHSWDDTDARRWSKNLQPLEDTLVDLAKGYLPLLTFPIRTGQHADTGFALGQLLDYSQVVGDKDLGKQIVKFANEKYLKDYDYPARYEPSGHDFFSTCLNEADLMRRVLPPAKFAKWLAQFLPELAKGEKGNTASLVTPTTVSDVTDGKLVHLAGLNFNRAWAQAGIASALPAGDPRRKVLIDSITRHSEAGMEYVFSGHYEGEHWLATFSVYVLTGSGL